MIKPRLRLGLFYALVLHHGFSGQAKYLWPTGYEPVNAQQLKRQQGLSVKKTVTGFKVFYRSAFSFAFPSPTHHSKQHCIAQYK